MNLRVHTPVLACLGKGSAMSDNYTQPIDDDGDDDRQPTPAELREAAKRGAKAKQEAEALKRENAFLRAGIDPEDQRLGYFVRGYNGDLDPSAIRQAAVDAGFVQPPQQQEDPVVAQARAGQQAVMAAATGALPEFDPMSAVHGLEAAYHEGGIDGLSAYAQQYGVTLQPEEI